jgi:hypothetical protein
MLKKYTDHDAKQERQYVRFDSIQDGRQQTADGSRFLLPSAVVVH